MLDPVAHDRQTALTQREKCAARARRPSLGLRPRFVRLAPAHSHPDCRCCLTLIGARQDSRLQRKIRSVAERTLGLRGFDSEAPRPMSGLSCASLEAAQILV